MYVIIRLQVQLGHAFINQVNSLVADGVLSQEEGQPLVEAAQAIIDSFAAAKSVYGSVLVTEYSLSQNTPNPFKPHHTDRLPTSCLSVERPLESPRVLRRLGCVSQATMAWVSCC